MASISGPDIQNLKDSLYNACAVYLEKSPNFVFHQQDILDFDIIPVENEPTDSNMMLVLQVIQGLVDDQLLVAARDAVGLCWRLRSVEEAKKYRSLTDEEAIVYSLIDEAGSEGLWSKTIKARTHLHDAVYTKAIAHLKTKNMIQDMKSVEHPLRKMYIRAGLRLSERATGGPWFTDGEFDNAFISGVSTILNLAIQRQSFYVNRVKLASPKQAKKTVKRMSPEEAKALRARGLGTDQGIEEAPAKVKVSLDPYPAGYKGYPTLHSLTLHLEQSDALKDVTLTPVDVKQLIDMLIFDDKIEAVSMPDGQLGYRALRKAIKKPEEIAGGVLNEVPCGRCPVFELCEEGGPVGPSNCEYFDAWLSM